MDDRQMIYIPSSRTIKYENNNLINTQNIQNQNTQSIILVKNSRISKRNIPEEFNLLISQKEILKSENKILKKKLHIKNKLDSGWVINRNFKNIEIEDINEIMKLENSNLKRENIYLNEEINNLRNEIYFLKKKNSDFGKINYDLEKENENLKMQNYDLKNRNSFLEEKNEDLYRKTFLNESDVIKFGKSHREDYDKIFLQKKIEYFEKGNRELFSNFERDKKFIENKFLDKIEFLKNEIFGLKRKIENFSKLRLKDHYKKSELFFEKEKSLKKINILKNKLKKNKSRNYKKSFNKAKREKSEKMIDFFYKNKLNDKNKKIPILKNITKDYNDNSKKHDENNFKVTNLLQTQLISKKNFIKNSEKKLYENNSKTNIKKSKNHKNYNLKHDQNYQNISENPVINNLQNNNKNKKSSESEKNRSKNKNFENNKIYNTNSEKIYKINTKKINKINSQKINKKIIKKKLSKINEINSKNNLNIKEDNNKKVNYMSKQEIFDKKKKYILENKNKSLEIEKNNFEMKKNIFENKFNFEKEKIHNLKNEGKNYSNLNAGIYSERLSR